MIISREREERSRRAGGKGQGGGKGNHGEGGASEFPKLILEDETINKSEVAKDQG
jgi:hypothetical protein